MIVRPARAEERAALEELQRRASLALGTYTAELTAHPDAIDLPQAHLASTLVAEDGGTVIGFAVMLDGELDGLFVDPKHWRQGIGAALVDAAVHAARRQGQSLVTVIADPGAQAFYERCGFTVEGAADTRFGPAIRMSR